MINTSVTHIQYWLVLLFFLLVPMCTYAVSDSFTLTQLIGTDTIAPTIPSPVTATPIATTQIDVTWGASTDDQNLTGYRLFRDAVHIATTSLTTYSDTGLTASTTYSYTVEAYDWFLNISTTSAAASTTTLPVPVVVVATTSSSTLTSGQDVTRVGVALKNLDIVTTENVANISWSTNRYAQFSLRWGKASAYDLGFVNNDVFKRAHITEINDLEPGATYVYELFAYSRGGTEYLLSEGSFTTQTSPDLLAPLNVSNLRADQEGDSVRLQWSNPHDKDFKKIRIVRNNNFYPRDPSNGYIAYEGTGESFSDRDALILYGTQYYTVFSYDDSGNISSGAVIKVEKNKGSGTDQYTTSNNEPISLYDPENSAVDTQDSERVFSDINDIDFSDVRVSQDNIWIEPVENIVRVIEDVPVVLDIPYELLSEHLKTILVTVQTNYAQPVSYMLRVNKDKTTYQAVLPSMEQSGEHILVFSVYDYKTQLLTTFEGTLQVEQKSFVSTIAKQVFTSEFTLQYVVLKIFVFFFLISFLLYLLYKRRRGD